MIYSERNFVLLRISDFELRNWEPAWRVGVRRTIADLKTRYSMLDACLGITYWQAETPALLTPVSWLLSPRSFFYRLPLTVYDFIDRLSSEFIISFTYAQLS